MTVPPMGSPMRVLIFSGIAAIYHPFRAGTLNAKAGHPDFVEKEVRHGSIDDWYNAHYAG
jgi:hypothetical protein